MNHSKLSSIPTKHHSHAWGRQMNLKESPNSEELAQRFTGKERDRVSGLDYFGARYYDSDVGYWLSPDAARQFPNLYGYVGNGFSPLNGVDPDGNDAKDVANAATKGAAGLLQVGGSLAICEGTSGLGCAIAFPLGVNGAGDVLISIENMKRAVQGKDPLPYVSDKFKKDLGGGAERAIDAAEWMSAAQKALTEPVDLLLKSTETVTNLDSNSKSKPIYEQTKSETTMPLDNLAVPVQVDVKK